MKKKLIYEQVPESILKTYSPIDARWAIGGYLLIKVKKQARFCKNKKIYFNQISKWINPLFVTFVTCPI